MSAAAAPMNGTASASSKASSSTSASAASSSSKQQLKTSASGKALDGPRKQASSPVDAASSKKPPPKAWQGPNPITQRPGGTSTPNGVANGSTRNAPAPAKAAQPQRSNADKHSHDRTLFLLANFTGLDGRVTLRNGEQFEGIFSGASLEPLDSRYTMKMVKRISPASQPQSNGAVEKLNEFIGSGEDHVVAFDLQDTIDLNVWDVQLSASETKSANGGPAFRTDTEISGVKTMREKELQPWQPGPDTDVDLSLDASGVGGWDQFAANEKLYNVRSDYDENLYTTTIDRSNPRYRQLEAEANRIAREIERSEPVNPHVAEERRMNANPDAGLDEEDKYSGVRRDFAPLTRGRTSNAYIPPSKRPITSQPTVAGAPYDPAIISSKIARPSFTAVNNSDSQAALSQQMSKNNLDADEASRAVAAAQVTTEAASPKPDVPLPTPSITVAGTGQPAAGSNPPSVSAPRRPGEGGTVGVERKVLDSFKQFSNSEKLKLQQHQRALQEKHRASARQEKSVKLNDLKKFAENFKLYSRVPEDLVPILAKTKEKQEEIVSKAEQQARDKEHRAKTLSPVLPSTPSKPDAEAADNRSARAAPVAGRPDLAGDFSQRQRQSQNARGPNHQPITSPRGPGMMNHRIAANQAQLRASVTTPNLPGPMPDLRIPPTAPSQMRDSGLASPSSAASKQLNVKAMEFRPNPAASTFTPGPGGKTSSEESKRPSVSAAATTPPQFFSKDVRPPSERASFSAAFNPIKRMTEKAQEDNKAKDFAPNGGIPQAYRTPPTWDCPTANQEKSYVDMFQKALTATISPMHTPSNGGMPYQNQLPIPLQNPPPQMPSAQQTPRFYAAQPHHLPNQHLDEQRVQQYASPNSSVQPSPRMTHPAMAYAGQMHPQMQGFPGAMPPYGLSPVMQMRPVPAGPQFAPQVPAMGGHMMMQQPSNGPYMNGQMGQQMPMYPSPGPGPAQPHFAGHPPQPGPYGTNPRGHPMSHQGSQQGHASAPMQYMGPPQGSPMMMQQYPGQMPQMHAGYPQRQFQTSSHPMQHRAMSGGGFNNHMTPRQHHAAPQQGPSPGNAPPMHGTGPGDEGK